MTPPLVIDESVFKQKFPDHPFVVKHNLVNHPLLQLPRLIELAQGLPADQIEYNAGNLDVNQDPSKTPHTGLSVEDTIQRIEEAKSWMVLKNVEQVPEYNKLLDECLDLVQTHSLQTLPGMYLREGFIFVTSPKSVTPFHIDPEHNFLLQIRGDKTVHIWDPSENDILTQEAMEAFHRGGVHRNQDYHDEYSKTEQKYTLKPGEGLHFPVTAPHWVQNEDNVSISFSITFRSDVSERANRIYRANAWLREKGMKPAPVGQAPWRDSGKDVIYRVALKARNLMSRH